MRIDKFLKVSRLIKRRTMAKEVADQGRVQVNGQTVKAGANVKPGDELKIEFGQKVVTLRVERLEAATKKDEAETMYTILQEEPRNKD
ncbi:RNA-binding S4 domain-containing protein [Salisediminibacterium halotolerans]|uniref:RQC P-site tRNA stabilizing factor n=1 Tax=Salisediminibacterium halotolerans TaxID=517425 RepID=A0A1H9VT51_9BACI|nr:MULTISPECIES: RNA-binding S4 domain-containing protein [Salisediminibacterium]RLJ80947.1 ribosomal 50S subunit-recycling heat shock protein [Actinophytocola xinjiangensis]RPE83648.1 ribosomal 50S subunit-recycling heat shock protein [Salisediminibacterium halotolerans]TWG37872.1 ribosomal 50S subunit-recycling heat shock protein [Salisediminibacterium halotolerans]SES24463.1 Ribosomal 50S subunit-recycling heat shock protein, contains S4 domain [Salisediminibacterium haloalkalitolerans]GEL0